MPSLKRLVMGLGLALQLAGCSILTPLEWPAPITPERATPVQQDEWQPKAGVTPETRVTETPRAPYRPVRQTGTHPSERGEIMVNLDQMPLPGFIQYTLGELLQLNFDVHPDIAKRQELVTLRSSNPMSRAQLLQTVQSILSSHKLTLTQDGELYRVLPDNLARDITPRFLRSQSLPDTPEDLRPIFQYVELKNASVSNIRETLNSLLKQQVQIMPDTAGNAIIIHGQRPQVEMALDAIALLDQPLMRGRQGRRVELAFVAPEALAKRLQEILESEGYAVALGRGAPGAISLIPVPESSSLILLAADEGLLNHTIDWIGQLDTPAQRASDKGLFVYKVQHANANTLARTVGQFYGLGGGQAAPSPSAAKPQPDKPSTGSASTLPSRATNPDTAPVANRDLVVNPATNSIIFRGSAKDFQELQKLLRELDRPTQQVLIEVTIAEVTLDDGQSTGIEWAMAQAKLSDYLVQGGTLGGLTLAQGGLNFTLLNNRGDTRALIQALASSNRARVLSTPRIMARNGEQATINVGDEVPVITAQQEAPVVSLVNNILTQAVELSASDIHLEPDHGALRVRYRIDGILAERLRTSATRLEAVISRIKLMAHLDIAERRLPQDGRLSFHAAGRAFDVRVSTLPAAEGESVVMRLLPKDQALLNLEVLGMAPDLYTQMKHVARQPHGILLVTGPTGSGKSTTLYALLGELNNGERKIITVEDPVEYRLDGITQVQAHAEIGYDFARALRAILRQDPDVIMIGEIRDGETARIAVQSSLTGHTVLSTLHTNDAVSAFGRLIDMGVEPYLLASAVRGVLAQRLVRRLCPHCRVPTAPPPGLTPILDELRVRFSTLMPTSPRLFAAQGCSRCHGTGYSGRVGIHEWVDVGPEMAHLIAHTPTVTTLRQALPSHFRTLREDGLIKAWNGETSLDEVFRVTGELAEVEAGETGSKAPPSVGALVTE